MKLLGIISVGSDITNLLLIRYFVFIRYLGGKNGNSMRQHISYLRTSRKPMIQLGRKHHTVFTGLGVSMKLVTQITMYLNDTYIKPI
jgi:hypothetical protein